GRTFGNRAHVPFVSGRRGVVPGCRRSRAERVAVLDVTALEPAFEPLPALRRRAVRERLGLDPTAAHLLDPIVPDRRGGAQALLDVAGLEQAALAGRVTPDPRETVRLQLHPHRERVRV